MITALSLLAALWVLFNAIAPHVAVASAKPLSWGRLPTELLTDPRTKRVKFYIAENLKRGYGYSVWAPPSSSFVVFNREFFQGASPALVRFVVAHELAHFTLGHHRLRWFAVVTGLILFPGVRRRLALTEDEADAVAAQRTGFRRESFPELI